MFLVKGVVTSRLWLGLCVRVRVYVCACTYVPISPQLFSAHSKLKTLRFKNLILIHPLLPSSLPVSTPNTIHHGRLTVCLCDSLDLTPCLSILIWISAC